MRYEKGHKAETRRHILSVASKRFRQDGISAAGIAGIMSDAGLTNGAFYLHFASKEDLVREVLSSAIEEQQHRVATIAREGQRLEDMVRGYLSPKHLKSPSGGCPSAALLAEIARQPTSTRHAYEEGTKKYIAALAALLPKADPAVTTRRAKAIYSLLVGTLQYARVVTSAAEAEAILENGVQAALSLAKLP